MYNNLTDRFEEIDKFGRHNRKRGNSTEMDLKEAVSGAGERSVDWLLLLKGRNH